jgi:GNAT superfamily N-acetyltransferase
VTRLDAGTLCLPDRSGVRLATRSEVPALSRVLSRAFHDDPVYEWIFPDPQTRARRSPGMFALFTRQMLRHGAVLTDEARRGVALWRPHRLELGPIEELSFSLGMLRLLGRRASSIGRGFAPIEARHPREPHVYLPLLGTEPGHQGCGVGSSLLAPVLRMCDARGLPAYLESSKEDNIPFYRRHGFELLEPLEIEGGPRVWPMKRVAACRP